MGNADPRLSHSAAAAEAQHRHNMDEQIRQAHAAAAAGYDAAQAQAAAAANKSSSAFSPIQAGMIQATQAAAGFPMTAGSRSYSFYDPIGIQKHSQV